MFGIPRARLLAYAGCLAVGLSVLLWPSHSGAPTAYDAQLRTIWHRKMAADAQALREARAALAASQDTVTRVVTRYRTLRDTLDIHDTVQVVRFVERADSVVRACTELQSSCERFRVRAESSIAGLETENAALRAAIPKPPGKISRLFLQLKGPALFVAGVWVGSRVVR